jgi:hypothetical protein
MMIIDLKTKSQAIRWPRIYRDCETILDSVTRDPAPCSHCGGTDHDSDHCPGQGG